MRVLLVHNYYKQRGGEDESFDAEGNMLEHFGHEVIRYTRHNDDIDTTSKTRVAVDTFWNRRSYRELKKLIADVRPDVVHCTNLFPLISTSAYNAANQLKVPVVQSLRNYRPMCLNSFFFRDGKICNQCRTRKLALPGIVNRCYRGSRVGSTIVAMHNFYHHSFKTWSKRVSTFFTPTEFARQQYIQAGFPGEKILVKPNFMTNDPGPAEDNGRTYAMFVGRLSPEKGLHTLAEAWKRLNLKMDLRIVGTGFLNRFVADLAAQNDNIRYEGHQSLDRVLDMLGQSRFLVMPSEWYETFGRTIMEAYSRGTPVVSSRLGAMAEIVEDGKTGISYEAGDVGELAQAMKTLVDDEPLRSSMGRNARHVFEEKYSAAANHRILTAVYEHAIENRVS